MLYRLDSLKDGERAFRLLHPKYVWYVSVINNHNSRQSLFSDLRPFSIRRNRSQRVRSSVT